MKTQSFLDNYFETGAAQGRLAHCILFYGADIQSQYDLALEIAKKLNNDELSQRWIGENKHPAVVTVSKLEGKTSISIEQSREIKNSLAVTSDYHRVFIFYDENGLSENNFTEEAANALLKTFEEPPANTTFFFLTRNKEDMLATIISRAQSFYVPSNVVESREFPAEIDMKEIPPEQLQNYIFAKFRGDATRLTQAMRYIETAKDQLRLNMNPQVVRETLALALNGLAPAGFPAVD